MRAHHHTYGLPVVTINCSNNYGPWQFPEKLPVVTINCSNNYGPWQFPEKLIPLVIANALAGKPLPIYGDGLQVRDWLYVGDHCTAIRRALEAGRTGEVYCVGGSSERPNIDVVHTLCDALDAARPRADGWMPPDRGPTGGATGSRSRL